MMKGKKSVIYGVWFVMLIAVMVGCKSQKARMVPEETLQAIMTETLITDAILNEDRKSGTPTFSSTMSDTVDFYAPIVDYYGYTPADVRYTIAVMATRKSNPLNNVLSDVVKNIEQINQRAEYRHRAYLKFDTMALNYYLDTLYRHPAQIKGRLGKFRIQIPNPKSGDYQILMDYRTSDDYRVRSRRIQYRQSATDSASANTGSFYMNKTSQEIPYRSVFNLRNDGADSLTITFVDSYLDGAEKEDSSYVRNVRVLYTPLASRARQDYYIKRTGGLTQNLREYYEHKFFPPQDSIAFPVLGRAGADAQKRNR